MLHELLFALLGKTGGIIIEYDDRFEIDPKINFLTLSEKELINSICILGYYYSRLE